MVEEVKKDDLLITMRFNGIKWSNFLLRSDDSMLNGLEVGIKLTLG